MPATPHSPPSRWSPLLADFRALWIMATLAVCGGFVFNALRENSLPLMYASKAERLDAAVKRVSQAALPGNTAASYQPLDLATFRQMMEAHPNALIFDARPEVFHRLGHVPKALSLPCEEFESAYVKLRPQLERDKAQTILVYCNGGSCEDGEMVANALVKLGYTQVYLFRGGWNEWEEAKLPEEKSL